MRKALLILGVFAAFAVPAVAAAAPPPAAPPPVICGVACDSGGNGWTGCTNQTAAHSGNLWPIASVRHYLVVSYCKVNGWITSISIAAHGCDTTGIASCTAGPAWQTGGGVGAGYATFEAKASWFVYTSPYYLNSDTLNLTVDLG
ncbi:MAG: hypothetical protein QOH16_353 [Gaiellaceae bacterium]|nr:hypothetical protein [Gaiellaceae bacterium]